MADTVHFSLRLDADVKAQVQALADAQNRSLGNYIETVLREHLADQKREAKRK